jgi:ribonucleoside-triphosphate reductase (formate)
MSLDFSGDFRPLHPGMGQAVAERTILRKKPDGQFETWGEVADRVATGNTMLCPNPNDISGEQRLLRKHIAKASLLMSGRHLQHGDATQPSRNMEVFTNCSTAPASFLLFYLLLNGSGVGRSYDDAMILIDWDNAPNVRVVLDDSHPDFDFSAHESVRDALHKYGPDSKKVMWYKVPDSREGWAKALEMYELAAFEKVHKDKMLILDFSDVRAKNQPIGGMQNRPASGPVPLMNAFMKAASLKGSGLDPWRQAMYVDHYFAECVLVGGARRAARMSTKFWKDPSVINFIEIKRPIEFDGLAPDQVAEYRTDAPYAPQSFLWSSNNSVTVDQEFWAQLEIKRGTEEYNTPLAQHARKVWKRIVECSYGDGTGEPGLINVDKLVHNNSGWDNLSRGDYVGYAKYQLQDETQILMSKLAKKAKTMKYNMITNPCGEIALNVLGGYCVIADVVPYHADSLDEAEEGFRVATRALMRVNLMDSLYKQEVARTNRIGVGMTGVHEFAWKFFQVGFKDLVNPDFEGLNEARHSEPGPASIIETTARIRSALFWLTLARFNAAVNEEAESYAAALGVSMPHTTMTIKPAGTTSKLFGLTEGWHLPSMAFLLRWVQFRSDDPQLQKYRDEGYPVRDLKSYQGTTIVGFPTAPTIATLGMGDELVLAGDASPEDQYKWLMLGEQFFIHGVDMQTLKPVARTTGNQISYTLKYKPEVTSLEDFRTMMRKFQPLIRACSVMPQSDTSAYEYQPEESVSKARYEEISRAIRTELEEDIGREHLNCDNGACPVDFSSGSKAA